ncbi:hypothetical protein ACUH9Y_05525 [Dermabacteraceae bacterium P13115]
MNIQNKDNQLILGIAVCSVLLFISAYTCGGGTLMALFRLSVALVSLGLAVKLWRNHS